MNHSAISFLMNKPIVIGHVIQWLLLLQEFDITILDKLGWENVVADFLSRLQHDDKPILVDETFLDEHLFSISKKKLWYATWKIT